MEISLSPEQVRMLSSGIPVPHNTGVLIRPPARVNIYESSKLPHFTEKQKRIIDLMVAGMPRKTICHVTGINYKTLDGYCKRIYKALEVHSHPQLIIALTKVVAR